MAARKKFIDRFSERFDDLDQGSRQAYLLRLVRERGLFETVFNAIEDGILVIDRELKLRYFNHSAEKLLALPADTANIRFSQLLPGIDWKQLLHSGENAWHQVVRQELEIRYPESRFVQFYLTPLDADTGLAVVILHDVTENRRRTGAELEQETVKAVSLLAAGVAHEIGNPLNSLYLNLQILEETLNSSDNTPADPGEVTSMLEVCKNEVERLDSIIHSFLGAIRPGKGVLSPVDLRELVVEVLNFMRPEIEARKVEVKCSWNSPFPPLSGDREQLKQAFYNIIRNAVQAMSNGGTLAIYGYSTPEYLGIEFADSGKGMTPEALRDMFIPFKTSKASGNGIGTMIIERVCREHGAEFGVVTEAERGTVFQIRFPTGAKRVRLLN